MICSNRGSFRAGFNYWVWSSWMVQKAFTMWTCNSYSWPGAWWPLLGRDGVANRWQLWDHVCGIGTRVLSSEYVTPPCDAAGKRCVSWLHMSRGSGCSPSLVGSCGLIGVRWLVGGNLERPNCREKSTFAWSCLSPKSQHLGEAGGAKESTQVGLTRLFVLCRDESWAVCLCWFSYCEQRGTRCIKICVYM